jgi:glucose-6-phosphate isomerase
VTFAIHPGPLGPAFDRAVQRLELNRFADALWTRRLDVWSGDAETRKSIANRLGWLDAPDAMRSHVPRLRAFADSVRQSGLTDVLLLGMGGSSLASEVMRGVIGVAPGYPRFAVLDSIDPDAVRAAMERSHSTLFILASKSGSTIELASLAAEAERRVRAAGVPDPGSRFVAITDDNTVLQRQAVAQGFRDLFINPSDIGGRFSALSLFGLVPAALMGVNLEAFLAAAHEMAGQCRLDDARRNPGLALGAVMGAASLEGRDKLTLVMPPSLDRFALWAEQLVAESTGKHGRGIVPIAGDLDDLARAGDRLLLTITLGADGSSVDERARTARVPLAALTVPDAAALGAEFFRWEVATATAGWLLDVNPFDEPNVQQAKDATRTLLATYTDQGRLPLPEPDLAVEGARIFVTEAVQAQSSDDGALSLLRLLRPGDYFALLAYLPPDGPFTPLLEEVRRTVTRKSGCASTVGYGPRYLHSTGQLHKGGANTGVFLIVTAEPSEDLAVPGAPYSFGVLEMAQAAGDFQSLARSGRRAVHTHLPRRDPMLFQRVISGILPGA